MNPPWVMLGVLFAFAFAFAFSAAMACWASIVAMQRSDRRLGIPGTKQHFTDGFSNRANHFRCTA